MAEIVLQTKLRVPSLRSTLVARPRLLSKLSDNLRGEDNFFQRKLTLVSAPPGYGKTTLISSWLRELTLPASWISLDEHDNDVLRFSLYLLSALQSVHHSVGQSALALLQSPQPPSLEVLLTLLINDIAALDVPVLLILDDYHTVHELDIHKGIAFLLDNQPSQLHLVIIGREDPPLPLHRLRERGEMVGVYAHDLRFGTEETEKFLNKTMGLQLTSSQVAVLENRTEGWVAGLQLAAISLQYVPDRSDFMSSFAGDDRFIMDFLVAEVIERQPSYVRDFLLKSALFNRFCASLCDELFAEADSIDEIEPALLDSQAIIDYLDQANLFIVPLDSKREWYRYHHLFADFLRLRLRKRPEIEIAEIHRRAAGWYAQHGYVGEAIDHYLALHDHELVANQIEQVGVSYIVQGRQREVLAWLAALPDEIIRSRPLLCVCQAWILNVQGQATAVELLLQQAENALKPSARNARQVVALMDVVRAYLARNRADVAESIRLLHKASQNLPPSNDILTSTVNLNLGFNYQLVGQLPQAQDALQIARASGEKAEAIYVTLIAMAVQANTYVDQGRLRRAQTLYQQAIDDGLSRNGGRPFAPAGYAYAGLGQTLYEMNDLTTAEQHLEQAVEFGELLGDWSMQRRGLLPLSWLKQVQGDREAAEALWRRALDVVNQAGSSRIESQLLVHRARLELLQASRSLSNRSAFAQAIDWSERYRQSRPHGQDYEEVLAQLTLAWVEILQGQVDQALARLTPWADAADANGWLDTLIKMSALKSLALAAKDDLDAALDSLRIALVNAAPEGYIRTFVDYGTPMQQLLQHARAQGITSDYVARILAAFQAEEKYHEVADGRDTAVMQPWVEPFTDRELRILRLMAAGLSHSEIADELFLSVNTIKWYSMHIYSKLGVHRRAHAVSRAQELGIL